MQMRTDETKGRGDPPTGGPAAGLGSKEAASTALPSIPLSLPSPSAVEADDGEPTVVAFRRLSAENGRASAPDSRNETDVFRQDGSISLLHDAVWLCFVALFGVGCGRSVRERISEFSCPAIVVGGRPDRDLLRHAILASRQRNDEEPHSRAGARASRCEQGRKTGPVGGEGQSGSRDARRGGRKNHRTIARAEQHGQRRSAKAGRRMPRIRRPSRRPDPKRGRGGAARRLVAQALAGGGRRGGEETAGVDGRGPGLVRDVRQACDRRSDRDSRLGARQGRGVVRPQDR